MWKKTVWPHTPHATGKCGSELAGAERKKERKVRKDNNKKKLKKVGLPTGAGCSVIDILLLILSVMSKFGRCSASVGFRLLRMSTWSSDMTMSSLSSMLVVLPLLDIRPAPIISTLKLRGRANPSSSPPPPPAPPPPHRPFMVVKKEKKRKKEEK